MSDVETFSEIYIFSGELRLASVNFYIQARVDYALNASSAVQKIMMILAVKAVLLLSAFSFLGTYARNLPGNTSFNFMNVSKY